MQFYQKIVQNVSGNSNNKSSIFVIFLRWRLLFSLLQKFVTVSVGGRGRRSVDLGWGDWRSSVVSGSIEQVREDEMDFYEKWQIVFAKNFIISKEWITVKMLHIFTYIEKCYTYEHTYKCYTYVLTNA